MFQFRLFEEYVDSFHFHYSQIDWPWLVVPVGVPFMGQIDLFKNNDYSAGAYATKKTVKKLIYKTKT